MTGLDGTTVVVTGAAGGQGAAEIAALARSGAHVMACDIAWPHGHPDTPLGATGQITPRDMDITDPTAWRRLADEMADHPVRGLVNNAGVSMRARLGDIDLPEWERVFAVNVTGPMLGIQTLMPLMNEGASIVNVGSLASVTGHAAVGYTASKWALRGLSRAASLQLGPRGIRVNLINPGFIETPMTGAAPNAFRQANMLNTPLERLGTVEDVAPLVLFLLSDESSFISGAEIAVDGGQWAHGGAKFNFDFERMAST